MDIDDRLIDTLLNLARLNVTAAERDSLRVDLQGILAFMEQLDGLDIEEAPGLLPPSLSPTRPDRARDWPDPQALLRNAPDRADGYFRVPERRPEEE